MGCFPVAVVIMRCHEKQSVSLKTGVEILQSVLFHCLAEKMQKFFLKETIDQKAMSQ
jgi:hypothetical protein